MGSVEGWAEGKVIRVLLDRESAHSRARPCTAATQHTHTHTPSPPTDTHRDMPRPGCPVPSTPERREGLRACYWEGPSESGRAAAPLTSTSGAREEMGPPQPGLRPPRLPEEMQIFPEPGRAFRATGHLVRLRT